MGVINKLCLQSLLRKAHRFLIIIDYQLIAQNNIVRLFELFNQNRTYYPIMGMALDSQRMYFYHFTTTTNSFRCI